MPELPKKLAPWAALLLLAGFGAGFFLKTSAGSGSTLVSAVSSSFEDFFGSGSGEEVIQIPAASSVSEVSPPAEKVPAPKAAVKSKSQPKTAAKSAAPAEQATTTPPAPETAAAWCAWKTPGTPRGGVLINEVAWMGAEDDSEAEWIELKNVSGGEIPLTGWRLQSKDNKTNAALSGILPAGGFYVIGRAPADADWQANQSAAPALSNSGEWLKLFNQWCGAVDELDARHGWPGGSNSSKKTLERKVATDGWQTSSQPGGSPGRQNTIVLAGAAIASGGAPEEPAAAPPAPAEVPAKILIAEIQTSGGAGKSDDDFVRLWNAGSAAADISGWKLRRRSKSGTEYSVKTFADGAEIPAGGFYVWANSKYPEGAQATSTATLSDDNSLGLFAADDALQDAVAWGADLVSPYAEGNAYPTNPLPGQVLGRKQAGEIYQDTGDNAADFEVK